VIWNTFHFLSRLVFCILHYKGNMCSFCAHEDLVVLKKRMYPEIFLPLPSHACCFLFFLNTSV
jgi:hypothetical protein